MWIVEKSANDLIESGGECFFPVKFFASKDGAKQWIEDDINVWISFLSNNSYYTKANKVFEEINDTEGIWNPENRLIFAHRVWITDIPKNSIPPKAFLFPYLQKHAKACCDLNYRYYEVNLLDEVCNGYPDTKKYRKHVCQDPRW